MSLATEQFDGDETEQALAKVLVPARRERSLYVKVPAIGKDRRTDGGARDRNATSVEFQGHISDYEVDDYVTLTFEPSDYSDKHVLTRVERADFTEPTGADEPMFPNTDIPTTCPACGREACAVVKTEYDSTTGGKMSDTADHCTIDPDNRGSWFGFSGEWSFVHGTER